MKRIQLDVQQEYERWDIAHGKMTEAPPSDGHRYIQHALSLLELLQNVAEIHPVAKGAIRQGHLFSKKEGLLMLGGLADHNQG